MSAPQDVSSVLDAQKRASPELKAVADFLRGKNGPKVRRGQLNGRAVDYFKGKTAVRTLLGPQYQKLKKVPAITSETEAVALLNQVLPHAFFLRVDRPPMDPPPASGTPKLLNLAPKQSFELDKHYAWFYDGSPLWTMVGGIAMIAVMLAGVMFPLWPIKLRIGVWYLSVGALGLIGAFIVLAIIRLIFWCITKIFMQKAIWMFPNLFEDVGFVDSFIPLWAWDEPKKKRLRKVGDKRKKEKKVGGAAEAPVVPAVPGTAAPSAAATAAAEAAAAPAPAAATASSAAGHSEPSPAPSPAPAASTASSASTTATAAPAAAPRYRQTVTVEEVPDEEL